MFDQANEQGFRGLIAQADAEHTVLGRSGTCAATVSVESTTLSHFKSRSRDVGVYTVGRFIGV
jgi:hypothetical protein